MTETEIRAWLARLEQLGSTHPDWGAFLVWARQAQALYDASRQSWRAQNPAIDVAAEERTYDLTPALLAIRAQLGVGEGGAAVLSG